MSWSSSFLLCSWCLIQRTRNYVSALETVLSFCCCCCDSPATLLLSSVVQVEEVCDHSRVVPQVLHCKLRRMALTVEQMLYWVWCHSTLRTYIWYTAGDASLVTVQKLTVTRTQLGESGMEYGPTEAADFQEVRYRVVKLQGLFGTKFVFASTTA